MKKVYIELGNGSRETLEIGENEAITFGRGDENDLVLPSPDVSRHHGRLRVHLGALMLEDQSANGTAVDGIGVVHRQTVELAPGTRLRIGPYSLVSAAPVGKGNGSVQQDQPHPDEIDEGTSLLGEFLGSSDALRPAPNSRAYGQLTTRTVPASLRRAIHRGLLEHLDLTRMRKTGIDVEKMRPRVRDALTAAIRSRRQQIPNEVDLTELIDELTDEALGLGPLEALVADETVSEIMVVDPDTIFIERKGRIEQTGLRFTDDDSVRSCIERIVTPLGRRIDEASPLVDARLPDGSRVNAVIPPLALRGPCITIRKFRKKPFTISDLIAFGTFDERMAKFLVRSVVAKRNILVSGGTGSGKTTLLNVLSAAIPRSERIITIEDAAELKLDQPHVVSLETRPPNMEGKGQISIRDLVRNALRMRPDRIVVGECRGGEAIDMLQAMNTGHDGSMTTLHANNPQEALTRLEALVLMSGLDLPVRAIREQISRSIQVIIQQSRLPGGARRITSIAEVTGMDDHGQISQREIFGFKGGKSGGPDEGEFRATGYLPSFLDEFIDNGLTADGDYL